MSNLAAVMPELGKIVIENRQLPEPNGREVVVKVEAVGVCGSDTSYFKLGRIGDYVVESPIVLGHEAAGVVHSIGEEVTLVQPGDRVAIEPGTPCRDCHECLAGRYHLCPHFEFLATPPYDGALLQYLRIDERNLFTLPASMSYEDGAMLEPLSVGIWACQRVGLKPGDHVIVTGAGPVGILAAETARALGAGTVTVVDVSDFRLELARTLGFETERSDGQSTAVFDVLLECSGAPGVLAQGLSRLKEAGRAAVVGMAKEEVALPLSQLNPKELTIALINRYAHTWPIAIDLVSSGRVDVRSIVTHRFPLDETEAALTLSSRVPNSLKAVIHPQSSGPLSTSS